MRHPFTKRYFGYLILINILLNYANGYRYLLASVQMKSHMLEQISVGKVLISRGHDVYMAVTDGYLTADEDGIKHIIFSRTQKTPSVFYNRGNAQSKMGVHLSEILRKDGLKNLGYHHAEYTSIHAYDDCTAMMSDQSFLHKIEKLSFDFVLIDGFVLSKCNAILPYHLGIPFAAMFGTTIHEASTTVSSHVPSISSTSSDKMTFFERITNFVDTIFESKFLPFPSVWNKTLLNRYPDPYGQYATSWSEVMNRATLFITTRDHILDWPQSTLPDYITLPGITQEPAKPLPKTFEDIMTLSKDGAVLVSFGSIFDNIDSTMLEKLMKVFYDNANLNFIFKITKANILLLQQKVPDNVHLLTWIPQNDLLGHRKLKLFMTHCGNNGQYESLYHGVPMIGLPLFAEQNHNCHRIQNKGFGICMDTTTFSSEELSENIKLILSDDLYTKKVNKMSAILKEDQLPNEKAANWIEHVTKYGGEHLRSSSRGMHWIKYWMVDVILFIVTVLFIFVYLVIACIKYICKRLTFKEKTQ